MSRSDIVIFGTGGMGRELGQLVQDISADSATWHLIGFLDSDPGTHDKEVHGYPVLGGIDWLHKHLNVAVAIGIGSPAVRWRVVQQLRYLGGLPFPRLVHPRAWIGDHVSIGEGAVLSAGCLVTTDVQIGRHVILNLGSTVSHDSVVGDFVTVAPGVSLCGKVAVGEGCDLGTGCRIIQEVKVGEWSVLGAGAVAVRDIPANVTAVGIPAKVIEQRVEGWHRVSPTGACGEQTDQ